MEIDVSKKNRWWNEPIFWFNKLVTKECFGEENVAKFKLEIFQNIQNLESDFDRKGFALEIIRQSMKADLLREEQLRWNNNRIRELKSIIKKLQMEKRQYEEKTRAWLQMEKRQNEEKIRKNEEKIR